MEVGVKADADLEDPTPDVGELFRHYNKLYFRGALDGFDVQWSSPRMTSFCRSIAACSFGKDGNVITLSEPMLKFRSTADLKNTLLHEMIHAFLFVKGQRRDRSVHGPGFRAWMDSINSCTIIDDQRPSGGYGITARHDFRQEVASIKFLHWECESCGDLVMRAMNQGPPTNGCIEYVGDDETCGNLLCHWHNHRMSCGGNYIRITTPNESSGQKRVSKGRGKGKSWSSNSSKKEAKTKLEAVQLNATTAAATASRNQKQAYSAALKKPNRSSRTKRTAERKEYGVASAWLNYYASEESDGPIKPLRNKRTERRKKNKMLKHSTPRKRAARDCSCGSANLSVRSKALVVCEDAGTRSPLFNSPEQPCPSPAPCMDIVLADAALKSLDAIICISDDDS